MHWQTDAVSAADARRTAGDRRFLLIFAVLAAWLTGEALFSSEFVLDDNRVENAQVAALVLALGLFLWRVPRADLAYRPLLVGLAAVTLLLILEEISWGQRLLGFETPALVQALNGQRETNLHNMHFVVILGPAAVLVVLAVVGLCLNRDLRTRSGLVLVPRVTRAKWLLIITATLLVVVAMPLLGANAGIDAAVVERIFSNEHLWQQDRSALLDPEFWDRIGLDRPVARNLLRLYQFSESIEMMVYAFVANVATLDPRDW